MKDAPWVATKGTIFGQQFKEHRSNGIDVAAAVGFPRLASSLLGRHVRHGSDHLAIGRDRLILGELLGNAEIGDVRPAIGVNDDVRRFQVAVDDMIGVCMINSLGNGLDQADDLFDR